MSAAAELPRLRYIDAIPIEYQDDLYIYLSDPQNIAPSPIILTPQEFFITSLLDGKHDYGKIRVAFAEKFGGLLIEKSHIDRLIANLQENYFLDTPEFYAYFHKMQREFRESPTRRHRFAGLAYEAEAEKLYQQIDGFYQHGDGAGLPQKHNGHSSSKSDFCAIMVPHIDLRVGGPCYTHGYRYLAENFQPELVIILGIAHSGSRNFFTASRKKFSTPFGEMHTANDFLDRWSSLAGLDVTEDDWPHRAEHSIEFQLPFLQHALQDPFEIVPVLCGAVEPLLNHTTDWHIAGNTRLHIEALAAALKAEKRRTAIILSVDLAHVGPKFGDGDKISGQLAEQHQSRDQQLFKMLENWDRPGLQQLMKSDLLTRRVDACGALLTLFGMFEQGKGRLLSYGQNFQPDTASLVTYGSMAFEVGGLGSDRSD